MNVPDPYAVAMECAMLAEKAEVSISPGESPKSGFPRPSIGPWSETFASMGADAGGWSAVKRMGDTSFAFKNSAT
jgi:hypothetical protein